MNQCKLYYFGPYLTPYRNLLDVTFFGFVISGGSQSGYRKTDRQFSKYPMCHLYLYLRTSGSYPLSFRLLLSPRGISDLSFAH